MMIKKLVIAAALMSVSTMSFAVADPASLALEQRLKAMYPKTTFSEVKPAAIKGLYEVVMGENVAYTDESGNYFLFGHLYDMKKQENLTAPVKAEKKKVVEFPTPLLGNAIKSVKGDGSRVVAVFSDPDCPYCKRLEQELAKLDNLTVYTFLFPLESLHPEAKNKSIAVWCADNPAQAWKELMLDGKQPTLKACANPISDNLVLGSRLGIHGTPSLISIDGRVMSGAAPAAQIDQWLNLKEGK